MAPCRWKLAHHWRPLDCKLFFSVWTTCVLTHVGFGTPKSDQFLKRRSCLCFWDFMAQNISDKRWTGGGCWKKVLSSSLAANSMASNSLRVLDSQGWPDPGRNSTHWTPAFAVSQTYFSDLNVPLLSLDVLCRVDFRTGEVGPKKRYFACVCRAPPMTSCHNGRV